ncbi:MAG: amino acid--tRNA ligase-related protein [Candidatus Bathyarchaeales archaeon]
METHPSEIEKILGKQEALDISILKDTANRHKLLLTPEMYAVVKIESSLLKGARKYFEENNFTEVIVPHITKATGACENIATMFELDYFGRKAYLSQTGQLYLEVLTPLLGKVWCTIQSFRAEPLADERHLAEFTLVELEFAGNFEELLKHIEGVICSMINCTLSERERELQLLKVDVERLKKIRRPFQRITYTEAVGLLAEYGVQWGDDLKSHHEKNACPNAWKPTTFRDALPKSHKVLQHARKRRKPSSSQQRRPAASIKRSARAKVPNPWTVTVPTQN